MGEEKIGRNNISERRHVGLDPVNTEPDERDQGQYIGRGDEMSTESIPGGVQTRDDRIAGNATQDAGPAARGANPQPGWSDPPDGHREASVGVTDTVQRKG